MVARRSFRIGSPLNLAPSRRPSMDTQFRLLDEPPRAFEPRFSFRRRPGFARRRLNQAYTAPIAGSTSFRSNGAEPHTVSVFMAIGRVVSSADLSKSKAPS